MPTKGLVWGLFICASFLDPARGTTIFFDGEGPEEGITGDGVESFSFMGSTWDPGGGASIVAVADPAMNASGAFAYQIISTDIGAFVMFDDPIDSIDFFYVDGILAPGHAIVYDAEMNVIAMFESQPATFHGDPANFIFFDPPEPIGGINFISGTVDNFTFTPMPGLVSIPTASAWGVVIMTLVIIGVASLAFRRRVA